MIEKEKKTERKQPAKAALRPHETGATDQPKDQLDLALKSFVAHRRDNAVDHARKAVRARFERKLKESIQRGAADRRDSKKTGSPGTK